MATVLYRVSIKNKDNTERTFVDWKGNTVTKMHEPIGTIFMGDRGPYWASVSQDNTAVSFDASEVYVNFYAPDAEKSAPKPAPKKEAAPTQKRKAPKKEEPAADPFGDE